jgi:hypothetical protein
MTKSGNIQERSQQTHAESHTDQEFDQWAKAVRQQMIEALKRRGNL